MTEMTLDVLYIADQSSGKDALSRHGRLGMLPRFLHLSVNALKILLHALGCSDLLTE
jgi:hypothetical protein